VYIVWQVVKTPTIISNNPVYFKGPQTANPRKPGRQCYVVHNYQLLDSGCHILKFVYQKLRTKNAIGFDDLLSWYEIKICILYLRVRLVYLLQTCYGCEIKDVIFWSHVKENNWGFSNWSPNLTLKYLNIQKNIEKNSNISSYLQIKFYYVKYIKFFTLLHFHFWILVTTFKTFSAFSFICSKQI